MKKNKLIIIFTLLALTASYADDAVQLFVSDLTKSRGTNVWFTEITNDTATIPKGGYIYRFELDIDSDGQNELFVASSLDADKKGTAWSVYRKNGTGAYMKIKDSFFMSNSLWVKTENGIKKYSFFVPLKGSDGGSYFGSFWLDKGVWHDSTRDLTDAEQAMAEGSNASVLGDNKLPDWSKIAKSLNLGASASIVIQKVLLAKYIQNSNTPWRNINTDFSLGQQYLDPADAADIASVASWQPPTPSPTP